MEKYTTDFVDNMIVIPKTNTIDISGFPGIITEMGKSVSRPIDIRIDSEYFRPKFEEILKDIPNDMGISRSWLLNNTLDQLIECLKNPEVK